MALRERVVTALAEAGYPALAPQLAPTWERRMSVAPRAKYTWMLAWSGFIGPVPDLTAKSRAIMLTQ